MSKLEIGDKVRVVDPNGTTNRDDIIGSESVIEEKLFWQFKGVVYTIEDFPGVAFYPEHLEKIND